MHADPEIEKRCLAIFLQLQGTRCGSIMLYKPEAAMCDSDHTITM